MKLSSYKTCFCAVGLVCLASTHAYAQPAEVVTNALPGTNALAQTNTFISTNALAAANDVQTTNLVASETNAFVQTNALAQTDDLVQTNTLEQTNALALTNTSPQSELLIQTNREGAFRPPTSGNSIRLDYPAFRMIAERNIFNPNRSRRRSQNYREERRRPPSTEGFSLVGTMSYEKGMFAFFDGSSSEYRKVLKPGDEIAGYKVAEIGYNRVKLTSKTTNEVELPIGMQMRREEEGEWSVGQQTVTYSTSSSSSFTPSASHPVTNEAPSALTISTSSSGGTPNAPAEASSGGSESEVLKRLMQKREETMTK